MNDIYYDTYTEGPEEEQSSPRGSVGWTVKVIFKIIFTVLILGILGILFTRMILARPPADIIRFHWTADSIAAFDSGDEDFRVYSHTLRNYIIEVERGENIHVALSGRNRTRNPNGTQHIIDGHFVISNIHYVPMFSQFQFTFRYTDIAADYIRDFFDTVHPTEDSPLWFTLSTEPGGEPIPTAGSTPSSQTFGYYYRQTERGRYTYQRIIFDGINLENVDRLYLNIHHVNAIDHEYPFMSMCIFDSHLGLDEYVIFRRDTTRGPDDFRRSVNENRQIHISPPIN